MERVTPRMCDILWYATSRISGAMTAVSNVHGVARKFALDPVFLASCDDLDSAKGEA